MEIPFSLVCFSIHLHFLFFLLFSGKMLEEEGSCVALLMDFVRCEILHMLVCDFGRRRGRRMRKFFLQLPLSDGGLSRKNVVAEVQHKDSPIILYLLVYSIIDFYGWGK